MIMKMISNFMMINKNNSIFLRFNQFNNKIYRRTALNKFKYLKIKMAFSNKMQE
jgi:hypothetical protein